MQIILVLLLLLFAAPAWAGDYTLTLSGDSSAACTISFSTEAESVDGTYPLQNGDITAFACTITEADPDLVLGLSDLQYPAGLDYRVSSGKVTALDLQTTTANQLQIGNATTDIIDNRWYTFGTGTVLVSDSNRVAIAEAGSPPDTTPPTDPASLVATAVSPTQINLDWTASTDAVGPVLYRIERCTPSGCSSWGQIDTSGTNSYQSTGLTAETTYNYRVRACDAVPNCSGYSNADEATTQAVGLTLAQQAATMTPGEWKQLSTANLWTDVDMTRAQLNAIDGGSESPSYFGGGGTPMTLRAWNGAGWDETENRWLFFGGGHSSYGGNEVTEFDVDTMTWTRLTTPAPLTFDFPGAPAILLPEDVSPVDGVSDTPGAPHTYDGLWFSDAMGKFCVLQQFSIYNLLVGGGGFNGAGVWYCFDPDTAQWTVNSGHDYNQAQCEYVASEGYAFCLDAVGYTSYDLYLLNDNGTETDCGPLTGEPQADQFGNIVYDPYTGNLYDFRVNGVTKIVIEADDCVPTMTLDAPAPSAGELGLLYDWQNTGAAPSGGPEIYLWNGDHRIIVYNTTTKTFTVRWFADQSATGPSGGLQRVLSKWRCFTTEGVCMGIDDVYTTEVDDFTITPNPRGGLWLWKPGADTADGDQAKLGTLALDGSTQTTLSVYMPVLAGDQNHDALAYVEYREVGGGAFTRGVDLFRQRPEFVTIGRGHNTNPEGWHGMIFDLTPGQAYEVRVTVDDTDGYQPGSAADVQTLSSVSTKPMPITDYTGLGTTTVTSAAQLEADSVTQCDGAGVGHVFTIPAATTITSSGDRISFGPSSAPDNQCGADLANPIVLRGADPATSKIDCTNQSDLGVCLYIFGSHVIVENLTIFSSDVSLGAGITIGPRTGAGPLNNITVRNVTIENVLTYGINGSLDLVTDGYFADNRIIGRLEYPTTTAGGGKQGIAVACFNCEIEHNTLGGFVDALAQDYAAVTGDPDTEQNRSIAMHHNLVLWNADDAIETDFVHRNIGVYHNLLANTGNCLSFQPNWGGPAYAFKNICINQALNRGAFKIKQEADDSEGAMIWNNTIIKNGSTLVEGDTGITNSNTSVQNNLLCGFGTTQYTPAATTYEVRYLMGLLRDPGETLIGPTLNVYGHNAYCQDGYFWYGPAQAADFTAWAAQAATSKIGIGDVLLEGETVFATYTPDFDDGAGGYLFEGLERDPLGKDYELDTGSSAWRAGIEIKGITDATPDIGACDTDDTDGSCISTGTFYGVR